MASRHQQRTTKSTGARSRSEEDVDSEEDLFITLYTAIHLKDWEQCRLILKSREHEYRDVANWVSREGADGLFAPMNKTLLTDAPLDVLELLYDTCPELASRRDGIGRTPLHLAASVSSEEHVARLLTWAPETTAVVDGGGRLPVHEAVRYGRPASILRKLLLVHPTAVYGVTLFGKRPLSMCVDRWRVVRQRATTVEELDRVTKIFKETLFLLLVVYIDGKLVERKSASSSPYEWFPEALRMKEIDIPLPFFLYLDHTMHMECVRPDEQRNFFLHLACSAPSRYK